MKAKIISGAVVLVAILLVSFQFSGLAVATQRTVKIGYIPLATSLPLYIAEANKYFDDAGIKYELVKMDSSNQLASSLVRGEVDAVFEVLSAPLLAEEAKNPGSIKIFSVSDLTTAKPFDSIIVKDDSIKTLNDLENKRIGVTPGSIFNSQLKYFLKFNSIDTDKITFVPVGLPEQLQGLSNNFVDAVYSIEPVIQQSSETQYGFRRLYGSVFANTINHSPQGAAAFSAKFLGENAEIAKKIASVFDKSVEYIRSNDGSARQIAAYRLNLDQSVAGAMSLFQMTKSTEIDRGVLGKQIQLFYYLNEIGSANFDLNNLIYQ